MHDRATLRHARRFPKPCRVDWQVNRQLANWELSYFLFVRESAPCAASGSDRFTHLRFAVTLKKFLQNIDAIRLWAQGSFSFLFVAIHHSMCYMRGAVCRAQRSIYQR
jgi:hypothetical protein